MMAYLFRYPQLTGVDKYRNSTNTIRMLMLALCCAGKASKSPSVASPASVANESSEFIQRRRKAKGGGGVVKPKKGRVREGRKLVESPAKAAARKKALDEMSGAFEAGLSLSSSDEEVRATVCVSCLCVSIVISLPLALQPVTPRRRLLFSPKTGEPTRSQLFGDPLPPEPSIPTPPDSDEDDMPTPPRFAFSLQSVPFLNAPSCFFVPLPCVVCLRLCAAAGRLKRPLCLGLLPSLVYQRLRAHLLRRVLTWTLLPPSASSDRRWELHCPFYEGEEGRAHPPLAPKQCPPHSGTKQLTRLPPICFNSRVCVRADRFARVCVFRFRAYVCFLFIQWFQGLPAQP